jgi:uncharacterized Zn-binding protein involved in type VI secretion
VPEPAAAMSALTTCSFGVAPASLIVERPTVLIEGKPAAAITDSELVNIPTFGMCMSLANPEVAAATTAALGVLTPMPCVPVLSPWQPGDPTVLISGIPALTAGCQCLCGYGGVVEMTFSGTVRTLV